MTGVPIIAALAAELPATREDDVAIHAYVKGRRAAWSAEDARLARTGHYDAHEGGGWQPCVDTVSVAETSARDARAKQEQAQHAASLRG